MFLFLAGLSLLLALLVLAWLASNNRWVDARPQPRPLSLQPSTSIGVAEANVFFDLTGLFVGPQQSPSGQGQALWAGQAEPKASAPELKPAAGEALWGCSWARQDCLALWQGEVPALRQSLQRQAPLLQRCTALADALAEGRKTLQEPVQPARAVIQALSDQYAALPVALHLQGLQACVRGLELQAVLAYRSQQAGQAAALSQTLGRYRALSHAQLQGSQSLQSTAVAWRTESQRLRFLTALLAAQAALAPQLAAELGPLPARATDAGAWMAAESFFAAQLFQEMGALCGRVEAQGLQAEAGLIQRTRCQFGLMPQALIQASDARWLARQQAAKAGPEALLQALELQAQSQAEFSLFNLPWRNPIGQILLDVGQAGYANYPARQADLLLEHRAAQLALALAQQGVPPAQRASWLSQQQGLTPGQRERLRLDADGLGFTLQPWGGAAKGGAPAAAQRRPLVR